MPNLLNMISQTCNFCLIQGQCLIWCFPQSLSWSLTAGWGSWMSSHGLIICRYPFFRSLRRLFQTFFPFLLPVYFTDQFLLWFVSWSVWSCQSSVSKGRPYFCPMLFRTFEISAIHWVCFMTVLLAFSLAGCFFLIFGCFRQMVLRTVRNCLSMRFWIFVINETHLMHFLGEGLCCGVAAHFRRLTIGLKLMTVYLDWETYLSFFQNSFRDAWYC